MPANRCGVYSVHSNGYRTTRVPPTASWLTSTIATHREKIPPIRIRIGSIFKKRWTYSILQGIQFSKPLQQPAAVPRLAKIVYDSDDALTSSGDFQLAETRKSKGKKMFGRISPNRFEKAKRVKNIYDLECNTTSPSARLSKSTKKSFTETNLVQRGGTNSKDLPDRNTQWQ
jgi:hypothetical protein